VNQSVARWRVRRLEFHRESSEEKKYFKTCIDIKNLINFNINTFS
jgi:hypothetical protein